MTFNLCRSDYFWTGIKGWTARRESFFQLIRGHDPDILALQEANPHQVRDSDLNLRPLQRAGASRNGDIHHQRNPIYFNPERWEVLDQGWRRIPGHPSKHRKRENIPRTVRWATLASAAGEQLTVVNTHLDPASRAHRDAAAHVLFDHYAGAFLVGDFNEKLTGRLARMLRAWGWREVGDAEPFARALGPSFRRGSARRLDWIMVPPSWAASSVDVVSVQFNGVEVSDHNAVVGEFVKETAPHVATVNGREGMPRTRGAGASSSHEEVFEALRRWRLAEARRQGVPAYVVAHDATLREIARRRPQTPEELASIPRFGSKKARCYADEIIELLSRTG